jgi:hypothetical protein
MLGPQCDTRSNANDRRFSQTMACVRRLPVFAAEMAVASLGLCMLSSIAAAQNDLAPINPRLRSYGGWQAAAESSEVHRAFFQSGSFSDSLPPLPQGFPGSPSELGAPERLPVFPPNAPTPVPQQRTEYGYPAEYGTLSDSTSGQEPWGGLTGNVPSRSVLPPDTPTPTHAPARSNSQPGSQPNQFSAGVPAQPAAYQQPPNYPQFGAGGPPAPNPAGGGMPASQPVAFNGLRPQQNNNVTSGLPFVTPPPQRTGRYPTSPYMPVWRGDSQLRGIPTHTVAAQVPGAGMPQSPAAYTANATQANLVSAQQVLPPQGSPGTLPQFQTNPAIYPTSYQQCAPSPTFPGAGGVPGTYVPPTFTPHQAPNLYSPNNAGYSPLFSLGQENYNVQIGRGIIGQPTVYVPGQPIRNFMRYIFP